MKLGSQVAEFGNVFERIKEKQRLMSENAVRLAAMRQLKEIQSQLTLIDFLDVLAVMDPANPLKSKVEEFETMLSELRKGVEEFVSANQFDSVDKEIQDLADAEAMETQEDKENAAKDAKEKEEAKKISLSGDTTKTDQKDNKGDDADEEDEKNTSKPKIDSKKTSSKKVDLDALKKINLSKKGDKK